MKKMILHRLIAVIVGVVVMSLSLNFVYELRRIESQITNESISLFNQLETILNQNNNDLKNIEEEYKLSCIKSANEAAYIISNTPSVLESTDTLLYIASLLNVDEIHIFDKEGTIINGTVPKYYGYTMNSGEQISYFLPMLDDKSLTLCQDIAPNTAEGKAMQYAACWDDKGQFIVQIGIEPVRFVEATQKNELSYLFSLLTTDTGATLYAADSATGEILGSTDTSLVGSHLSDIGLDIKNISTDGTGFYAASRNQSVYCIFTEFDSIIIGRSHSTALLYSNIWKNIGIITLYLLVIAVFLVVTITRYLNNKIVNSIDKVNKKLESITEGNLDKTVNVMTTPEFAELSSHINTMISGLLETTDKIANIMEKAEIPIGVYEYGTRMPRVRATYQVQRILNLTDEDAEKLLADSRLFADYITELQSNTLDSDPNICILSGITDRYVKSEIIESGENTIGFIMDVTEDVLKRMAIETQRDIDLLTQLYNRRGLESRLEKLFREPDILGHCAIILLDSDGLKTINDKYGHKIGDRYLCETANLIRSANVPNQLISRQGGDEFVVFYYGFSSNDELLSHIHNLRTLRDNATFRIDDGTSFPISYSLGYAVYKTDGDDYITMLREADMRMYAEKRLRKSSRQ